MTKLQKSFSELPDDIARHPDPGREALQALAIEGYRSEKLTHHQAAQLLGLTRFEFNGFLKDRQIYDHAYSVEDLERDLTTLRKRVLGSNWAENRYSKRISHAHNFCPVAQNSALFREFCDKVQSYVLELVCKIRI